MSLLSFTVVNLSSILVLAPNGKFLDCVAIALGERYKMRGEELFAQPETTFVYSTGAHS